MINTNQPNLFYVCNKTDVVNKVMPLLESGDWKIRTEDQKIVPRNIGYGYNTPWVYVENVPSNRCDIYMEVFWKCYVHIHSHCRNCWKTVVRPRTLKELITLYELQKSMAVPSKSGLELRQMVFGNYGGYFYSRSKDEGLRRYKQVRTLVSKVITPDVEVILKRFCTEYEIGNCPSSKVPDATQEEIEFEKHVESYFPPTNHNIASQKHMVANVIGRWIEFAYSIGDETYKDFTGGEPLYQPYETYHDKE